MKFRRRSFLQMAVGASALSAVSRIGFAQAYPSRPARIVVGFAAGTVARVASALHEFCLMGKATLRWLSEPVKLAIKLIFAGRHMTLHIAQFQFDIVKLLL